MSSGGASSELTTLTRSQDLPPPSTTATRAVNARGEGETVPASSEAPTRSIPVTRDTSIDDDSISEAPTSEPTLLSRESDYQDERASVYVRVMPSSRDWYGGKKLPCSSLWWLVESER